MALKDLVMEEADGVSEFSDGSRDLNNGCLSLFMPHYFLAYTLYV